jgi:transposase-like protein
MGAVALVWAGKPITTAAAELKVSAAAIHNWVRQDQIDRGERPGIRTPESIELVKAKKRIRQLEEEVEILEMAATLLEEGLSRPKRIHPVVDVLVEAGYRVKVCGRLLGVNSPKYYRYEHRPLSPTQMRRQWLTGSIREIHTASRQAYGSRRVHAELTLGMGAGSASDSWQC